MNGEEIKHWACVQNKSPFPVQIGGDVKEINTMWLRPNEVLEFDVAIPRGMKMLVNRARRRGVEMLLVHLVDQEF